jgi:hypothetical protein
VPPDLLDAGVTNVPNASVIVYARIPETMQCGRSTNALVRVQNIGTRTWKNVAEDLGHKLGRLEPHEPLFLRDNLRFYMGWKAEVPPGSAYTFGFTLTAPREVGTYRLRLQMLEELVEWFGPIVERDIEVLGDDCAPAEEALTCDAGPATVGRDVEQAIDWLIGTSPHIFDFDINLGGGAYALRDEIGFTYGVTERLNALGLTAVVDGWAGDEIQVKRDRTFSDTFDIVRAGDERSPGGYVRRGSGAFRGTCHPAAF